MRKFFAFGFLSILICFSSVIQADEVSIGVDTAILKMHKEINALARENKLLKNQVELLQEAQQISSQKIKELFKMLEIKTTNKIIEDVIVAKKEDEDKALSVYENGRKQLIFGDHDAAIILLQDYLTNYPNYKNSSDAQYWLGRAFYAKASYAEARVAFVQFQQQNPLHSKYANSMYELAQTLVGLKEIELAKDMLSTMLKKFPTHNLRTKANIRLKEIQELLAKP